MPELLQALWFSGFVVFMWWATWEDERERERRLSKRLIDDLWWAYYQKKRIESYLLERWI